MKELRDKLITETNCFNFLEDEPEDLIDKLLPIFEKEKKYFISTKRVKGGPEFQNTRCIGYYNSLEQARQVILETHECLEESGYYQYAIIEAFGPGWYPRASIEEWYEFVDGGVKKIKKPKQFDGVSGFGIG